ncbi:MAG TPA: response regulator [Verrucomicrobiae bacterium]|nr:response regulator [Verrucomicrobiae bacterium]
MKRILFVEDDELLREAYQVMTENAAGGWKAATAQDAHEALELLKQSPFDVVASDMRMDGMSGTELLAEVSRLYPQTSRIIISGVADQAEAAEALKATHQFLSKPVEFKTLEGTLARIRALDEFLNSQRLKTLAARMGSIPSFPALYLEIMKAIEADDTPLDVIHDLMIKDPGLTAKVLQVANSAAMSPGQRIMDPLEAVQHLGVDTIRALALSAHVFANFTASQRINFPMNALWAHLMSCGSRARAIMEVEGAGSASADAAYTAGILHDIGKLMLADSLPAEFQEALARAATSGEPYCEIEMEVFGASHAALAAYLLGLWGLPAAIVEAVAFHHAPANSGHQEFSPLTAVHVANALEHESKGDTPQLDLEYLRRIGVEERLDDWRRGR